MVREIFTVSDMLTVLVAKQSVENSANRSDFAYELSAMSTFGTDIIKQNDSEEGGRR